MPGLQARNERTLGSLILQRYALPLHNGIRQQYRKLVKTNNGPLIVQLHHNKRTGLFQPQIGGVNGRWGASSPS